MRNAQKKGEKSSSTRIGVALIGGLGGSMLLTLLACGILAGMISSEKVPEEWAAGGTMVTLIISSFAGAMIAYQLAGVGRLPICLAAGVLYDLVLLGCNALFFDGRYQNLGINALVILGGCGAAALLGLGKGERRKKGHPSRRYKW